ncbi:hypothetical protein OOOCML_32345 (plasmid) [Cupriavidus necator H16]
MRAAEELHLTQPAVSMQVKQLESVVGLALFERVKGQFTLRPATACCHHASRILGEVKDAEECLQAVKDVSRGRSRSG